MSSLVPGLQNPLSKVYPVLAGQYSVPVTGELVIDTGLKELRTFQASLQSDVVANEESTVSWEIYDTSTSVKVKVKTWKGGTAHGTAGDNEVLVSWFALGDR